jgi:multidrug efflux system outer membrane protein
VLACGLSACAWIHDNVPPATMIAHEQIRLADDIRLARDGWPQAHWWTRYQDRQLDTLIDLALEQAPGILVARRRVEQAGAQVGMVRAASRLKAEAIATVNRQHVSANGFLGPFALNEPTLGFTGPWYTEGIVGIAGSYAFDLWGKERSAVEAAIGRQNAQLAEQATVELELSADVAQQYFAMQTIRQKLALLIQARDIQATVVAAASARADRGLASKTPIAQAQALLFQMDQQISLAQTEVRQLREILRALLGAVGMPELSPLPLPATASQGLPEDLPYRLLARRPDLQVLRWYVQSSLSQVESAKAAFYPSFDIKAFFGFDALHLGDLLDKSSRQFNLIPGLSLPLFDGGRLNANLLTARTASNTLIEQYNQAVLNAVRDVAVAGNRLQGVQQQQQLQAARLDETQVAERDAAARYRQGLVSKVTALEAQLPVLSQRAELVEVHGRQMAGEIALIKALGGGYARAVQNADAR